MGRLSATERETIILFNEAEDSAQCEVYSPTMRRRLKALLQEQTEGITLIQHTEDADRYVFPKKWIRIAPPRKTTERQREHLAKARERLNT
jgi:hypothetical protein